MLINFLLNMGTITDICCSNNKSTPTTKNKGISKEEIDSSSNETISPKKKKTTNNSCKQIIKIPTIQSPANTTQTALDQIISQSQIKNTKGKICYDDFQIKGKLGSGSYGAVFMVQLKSNMNSKKIVNYAMKRIALDKISNKRTIQNTRLQKFILSQLNNPFITQLKFAFKDQHYIFLIMQCAIGGSIDSFLNIKKVGNSKKNLRAIKFKKLGEMGVRFVAANVILGIQHLHKNNIMYRDLKPQNIIVFQDGYVKLTDFGLSKIVDDNQGTNSQAGTVLYFAPEMVTKQFYTKSIDLWALGIFLYELATSETPFKESQILMRNKFKDIVIEAQTNRDWKHFTLSQQLKDLINKLLVYEPSVRLGVNGMNEIKNHSFFQQIDWSDLENKKMRSPLLSIIQQHPIKVSQFRTGITHTTSIQSATQQDDEWTYDFTYSLAKQQ